MLRNFWKLQTYASLFMPAIHLQLVITKHQLTQNYRWWLIHNHGSGKKIGRKGSVHMQTCYLQFHSEVFVRVITSVGTVCLYNSIMSSWFLWGRLCTPNQMPVPRLFDLKMSIKEVYRTSFRPTTISNGRHHGRGSGFLIPTFGNTPRLLITLLFKLRMKTLT